MAANTYRRGLVGFVNQIRTGTSPVLTPSVALSRRNLNVAAVYEKNIDELDTPTIVPDNIIQPDSDKYWAPDPETGVFGPASEINTSAPGGVHAHANGGGESVLDQQAFFRPLEDLDKPVEEELETTPQL